MAKKDYTIKLKPLKIKKRFLERLLVYLVLYFCIIFPVLSSDQIPSFSEVKSHFKSSDFLLQDRYGRTLHEIRVDEKSRQLEWVPLSEISDSLVKFIIIAEDKKFYEHRGVDWTAALSSFFRLFTLKPKRGASTISMQVAGILNDELTPKDKSGRTISQKWNQMKAASQLEETWTKEEILEAYLNLVHYRGELVGVSAASRGIFQKSAHGLDIRESLVLASLIKNPNAGYERLQKRACYIAESAGITEDCKEILDFIRESLGKQYYVKPRYHFAFHLASRLFREKGASENIKTTLDRDIQKHTLEIMKQQMTLIRDKNVRDSAILIVKNDTGEVLAYSGGSGNFSSAGEVDAVLAKRQAGSTLKPFVYGLAFDRNIITADSLLEDSPVEIQVGTGIYSPSNYQEKFHGIVTARQALGSSLNVPAVRTLSLAGVDDLVDILSEMQFKDLRDGEFYGLSIALGSLDVRLWDLVSAYRVLANGGIYTNIKILPDETSEEPRRIFSRKTTEIISSILSDRDARSLSFGLENPLATRYWSAVKTGTSKDMRDNWCVGYSEKYTIGVWVGNYSGEPMWNVSGVTGAAPIWIDLMNFLSSREPGKKQEIKSQEANKENKLQNIVKQLNIKILSPTRETIFAIDPDIPEENQRIWFETNTKTSLHRWFLDGKETARANEIYFWKPEKGKHKLELVDAYGNISDMVFFEVR